MRVSPRPLTLDYSAEPLVQDRAFRAELLAAFARIAIAVEQARGAPQDIEGPRQGHDYFVVQSCPQIGLN
jgi:hypothetical protein